MIAHVRGTLLVSTPGRVIVECAGVGYELAVSVATFSALGRVGGEASLHVYTRVAEDQLALFGFAELGEKQLFEKLLTISGIGPKLAITVLSGVAAERLVAAIRAGDHDTLVKIPGIGKKTAERVVLELKDKLEDLAGATTGAQAAPAAEPLGALEQDVLSALINLGYPRPIAQRAIEAAGKRTQEGDASPAATFEILFRAAMASIR